MTDNGWSKYRENSAETIDSDPLGPDRHSVNFYEQTTGNLGGPTTTIADALKARHEQKMREEEAFEKNYREKHNG